jgi:hypothetical protein
VERLLCAGGNSERGDNPDNEKQVFSAKGARYHICTCSALEEQKENTRKGGKRDWWGETEIREPWEAWSWSNE